MEILVMRSFWDGVRRQITGFLERLKVRLAGRSVPRVHQSGSNGGRTVNQGASVGTKDSPVEPAPGYQRPAYVKPARGDWRAAFIKLVPFIPIIAMVVATMGFITWSNGLLWNGWGS